MFCNREREKTSKEMDMYSIMYMMLYILARERMFPSSCLQQFSDIVPLKLYIQTAEEAFLILNES